MVRRDILAGLTTFLTLSYIIVVNPLILSVEGTGINFAHGPTGTILAASVSTFLWEWGPTFPLPWPRGWG